MTYDTSGAQARDELGISELLSARPLYRCSPYGFGEHLESEGAQVTVAERFQKNNGRLDLTLAGGI
jgi:hypothetical protein